MFLDRRLGRRKVQLKRKFCVVFQRSSADKFSVACTFHYNKKTKETANKLTELQMVIHNSYDERLEIYENGIVEY